MVCVAGRLFQSPEKILAKKPDLVVFDFLGLEKNSVHAIGLTIYHQRLFWTVQYLLPYRFKSLIKASVGHLCGVDQ